LFRRRGKLFRGRGRVKQLARLRGSSLSLRCRFAAPLLALSGPANEVRPMPHYLRETASTANPAKTAPRTKEDFEKHIESPLGESDFVFEVAHSARVSSRRRSHQA
jgi:hypothetical protein